MPTTIRLPDGEEVDIDTDDPKQAAGAAQKIWANKQPPDQIQEPADPRVLRAAGQGLSFGFGDEIEAAARSAYSETGYDEELAKTRAKLEEFHRLHPTAATTAEITGAVAPALLSGGRTAPASIGAAVGRGAATAGGLGAAYGYGSGEGLADRLKGAGIGLGMGLGFGAAAPLAYAGSKWLAAPVARLVRGAVNPEREAARRVATTQAADAANPTLPPLEWEAAQRAGMPVTVAERGGEATRALARQSANISPTARDTLNRTIDPRFEQQGDRINTAVRNLVGGGRPAHETTERLQTAARAANRPAYTQAYRSGDRPIWSPELERLSGSPEVLGAIKSATVTGKSRAITEGYGAFRPGVNVTPDGRLQFQRGPRGTPTYPNLQFWDYTKRELDAAANRAARSGDSEAASRLRQQATALREELDRHVPAYARARHTAATYFGAEDAFEAGQNFLSRRVDFREAAHNVNRMNPAERQLFREGYADTLIRKVEQTGDRRNVINRIFSDPDQRNRMHIALGPRRYRELEAHLRVEAAMDRLRPAVQGQSTTTRQLAELGLDVGGQAATAGLVGFGTNILSGEPLSPRGILVAALFGAGRRGGRALTSGINERVANRVATMLTSDNPAIYQRGISIMARSPRYMERLRQISAAGGTAAAVGANQ